MSNKRKAWGCIVGSALLFATGYAVASTSGGTTIGTVASTLTGSIASISKLIGAGSYVAGVALALAGMVKFKAHKDAPTQTKLSEPLVLLMVAAGLIFLPSVINSVGASLGFAKSDQTNSTGTGIN